MSEEREESARTAKAQQASNAVSDEEEDDEDEGSPFDHPAFLPVLLAALALWFGFDGWFSETIESVRFNRYGFIFLVGFAAYATVSELRRVPYLWPALWALFSVWLAGFWLLGSDDAWWRDDAGAMFFNQAGAVVCALAAVVFAIREARRAPAGDAS